MARPKPVRRDDLRLVPPTGPELPLIATDAEARAEFEALTQRLVDVVIEIMDLADGDPDLECNGDPEDGDAVV